MLIAYLSGWLVPPVILFFPYFFQRQISRWDRWNLEKKNEENVSNSFTTRVESRTICHTCRRAFRVKVTIIWGSIYFLLLFFSFFLEGILPQFPTAWEFHHSTVILIPLKKKNSPHTIFFFFCFRRCVSWQDPGSREWNKLIRWKRGGGDSSRCMLCVKAGLKGAENSNTKRINNDFVRAYQKEPASDTTANTVKRGSSPS